MEYIRTTQKPIAATAPAEEVAAATGTALYFVGETMDFTPINDGTFHTFQVARVQYTVPAGGSAYVFGHIGVQPTASSRTLNWGVRVGNDDTVYAYHQDTKNNTVNSSFNPQKDVLTAWNVYTDLDAGDYISYMYATISSTYPATVDTSTICLMALVAGTGTLSGSADVEWRMGAAETSYYPSWWY